MPAGLRRLLLVGVILVLVGLVGMAVRTVLQPGASLLPFAPFYGGGLAALVVALFWWLVDMTRRREAPPTNRHSSSDPGP